MMKIDKYNLIELTMSIETKKEIEELLSHEELISDNIDLRQHLLLDLLYETPFNINKEIFERRASNDAKIFQIEDNFIAIKKIKTEYSDKITMFKLNKKPKYFQKVVMTIEDD